MIPDNCNLPQNAKWTDFDNDYTAEEREELRELKRRWEDGEVSDPGLVFAFEGYEKAHIRHRRHLLDIRVDRHSAKRRHELAWFEAAKEILRGVL
jgi:hypothetical protein